MASVCGTSGTTGRRSVAGDPVRLIYANRSWASCGRQAEQAPNYSPKI